MEQFTAAPATRHEPSKSNIGKAARLKGKVIIDQEETIPNIWNGTMFGDLD